MTITRWQCAILAFIVMLAGPYATWLSVAQAQQTQTATMDTTGSIFSPPRPSRSSRLRETRWPRGS